MVTHYVIAYITSVVNKNFGHVANKRKLIVPTRKKLISEGNSRSEFGNFFPGSFDDGREVAEWRLKLQFPLI